MEENFVGEEPDSEPDSDESEGLQDSLWDDFNEWEDDTDLDELQHRIDAHGVIWPTLPQTLQQCYIGICGICLSAVNDQYGREEFEVEEYRPRKANAIRAEYAHNPSLRYVRSLFEGSQRVGLGRVRVYQPGM
ncbi:hypothetical protein GRF29_1g2166515 [Pseudopithomyces chartarum]|uniref:Uncharacterized protein n=1 Tax=Pseudopithomyces chartarum TaxID=1892770 RepID=A0AAN6M663_9PLEO|nr:hypothetical protein GRF29_1g2166515 [Pseudopithomyces chartarum]